MCVLCVPDDDPVNGFEPEYLSLPSGPLLRSLPLTLEPPSTTPTHPVVTICAFESNEFATFTFNMIQKKSVRIGLRIV